MDLQAERNYSLLEKNVENSGELLPLMSTTEVKSNLKKIQTNKT